MVAGELLMKILNWKIKIKMKSKINVCLILFIPDSLIYLTNVCLLPHYAPTNKCNVRKLLHKMIIKPNIINDAKINIWSQTALMEDV